MCFSGKFFTFAIYLRIILIITELISLGFIVLQFIYTFIYQMKQNSGQKYPSKISVESLRSRNSNSISLDRPSWGQRDPSLNKKVSLVYVMSIESDRKSDLYERLLQQNLGDKDKNIQFPPNRNSLGVENQYNMYLDQQRRNSYERRPVLHSCECYLDCNGQQCPCFLARNQICLKGSCCQTCIQMKNSLMLADRGEFCTCKNTQCLKSYCKCFQNNGVCTSLCRCEDCRNKIDSQERANAIQNLKFNIQQGNRKHCTCKKTKCNKKYCSCYAMGLKCTKQCQCQNCTNCDRIYCKMEEQSPPEFIDEEDLSNMQFPERMSFEKPEFVKY